MTEGIVGSDAVDEAVSSSSVQELPSYKMILGVKKEDYGSVGNGEVRFRKSKSSSIMQDIVKEADKKRKFQPNKPPQIDYPLTS
uniref:Uncharacterized protein n=1 Tax=Lepeophtheirus salmonis TaxID=72036 RepID=A0A0K2UUV2_LEPSM